MEVTKILRIISLQAQIVNGDLLPISNFEKSFTIWRHCGVILRSDQRQTDEACNM
jgi:hypothetical protein